MPKSVNAKVKAAVKDLTESVGLSPYKKTTVQDYERIFQMQPARESIRASINALANVTRKMRGKKPKPLFSSSRGGRLTRKNRKQCSKKQHK